jgi:hypothetical protein
MDKSPYRSLDEETDRVRDRVIDHKWCDLEMFAYLDGLIASVFSDIGECCTHICLLELDELVGHRSCIEWSVTPELLHEVVDSPDMVDMTVSDTGSDDVFPTTVGEIGDRRVDTILVLVGELDPHIDDDHLIFVLEAHTVESDLFHTAEWYDPECLFAEWFSTLLFVSEKFPKCLYWCEKWIGSLRSERIFEEKRVSRTEVRVKFFSRIKKVSWCSF